MPDSADRSRADSSPARRSNANPSGSTLPPYLPTPAEIAASCQAIRSTWSRRRERQSQCYRATPAGPAASYRYDHSGHFASTGDHI